MNKFIFKSANRLVKNSSNTIETVLTEQRHQRSDLAEIKFMLHKLLNNKDLQDTVDKYYEEAPDFAPPNEESKRDLD